MKKISLLLLLVAISIFVFYQYQKPILTESDAIVKAKEYVEIVNIKMNAGYDTEKPADYCILKRDMIWNKVIGNRYWSIMIDGVAVKITAGSGEFVRMVFPLDGVITKLPE